MVKYERNTVNSLLKTLTTSFLFLVLILCYIKTETESPLHPDRSSMYQQSAAMFQLLKNEGQNITKLIKPSHFKFISTAKFIPSIKLNAYQTIAYRKTNVKKSKLLHSILNNDEQRKKFKYIMKKAKELKLPHELALIPVIESEYKNKAVSPKGAAGLWQLMPYTARLFGLSSKQRFELAASTKAALRHFKDLHKEFGNWELAIAAYNAGDGRVHQALRRNPKAKTVQELRLPRETRNYVLSFFQLQKALKSYDLT